MAHKRTKRQGSVRLKEDGRWEARTTIGYNDLGIQKYRYFYGSTKEEAETRLTQFLADFNKGILVDLSRERVGEYLDSWYEFHIVNSVKHSTRVSYEMIIRRHLKPHFGDIMLRDLKGSYVQGVYIKLLKAGRTDKKGGLSPKTIRNIHLCFHMAMEQAVNDELLFKNPLNSVTLPKVNKEEIKVFSKEEQKAFEQECLKHRLGEAMITDLYTGMRQGELLALKWSDIDFKKRRISITKQLQRLKDFSFGATTKTKLKIHHKTKNCKSRVISFSPAIGVILARYKAKQDIEKEKWGSAYNNLDLVFCREDGYYFDPKTFFDLFKRILKKVGIEEKNIHAMRHTFATRALEAGIPAKVVSAILGHSGIQITLDTYSHVSPELQEEEMQKISDLYLSIETEMIDSIESKNLDNGQ